MPRGNKRQRQVNKITSEREEKRRHDSDDELLLPPLDGDDIIDDPSDVFIDVDVIDDKSFSSHFSFSSQSSSSSVFANRRPPVYNFQSIRTKFRMQAMQRGLLTSSKNNRSILDYFPSSSSSSLIPLHLHHYHPPYHLLLMN
jgi:hypothetical protein